MTKYSAVKIRQRAIEHNYNIENPILGCDDAHMTPYEQYLNMLQGERRQLEKVLAIVCPDYKKEESNPFDMSRTHEESFTLS